MKPAGQRDRMVTIEALTEVRAPGGIVTQAWSALATIPMAFEQPSEGRLAERFAAGQLTSAFDATWDLAYRTDMDPEVIDLPKARRLVFRGRTYDITSAEHEGRRRSILLRTRASSRAA